MAAHSLFRRALATVFVSSLALACAGPPVASTCSASPSCGTVPTSAPSTATTPAGSVAVTEAPFTVAPPTARPSAGPSPDRDPGTARTDAKGIDQVWVPGGTFRMGSEPGSAPAPSWATVTYASEHPAHEVRITRGYWIDTTEVTVADFRAFKDAGGYTDQANWSPDGWTWRQGMGGLSLPLPCLAQQPDQPQVCVTWFEAEAYAHWRGGRLPTEAEWEFAARGPDSSVYPWGDAFDAKRANLDGASGPVAVGRYAKGASWVGALDMAGNAMEWVADWWSGTYYAESPKDDPAGPATGTIKIEKGGWWGPPDGTGPFISRSSFRLDEDPPTYEDKHIGIRVVSDG